MAGRDNMLLKFKAPVPVSSPLKSTLKGLLVMSLNEDKRKNVESDLLSYMTTTGYDR